MLPSILSDVHTLYVVHTLSAPPYFPPSCLWYCVSPSFCPGEFDLHHTSEMQSDWPKRCEGTCRALRAQQAWNVSVVSASQPTLPHFQEADWAREFLISLHNMYESTLPPGMAPHQQQLDAGGSSSSSFSPAPPPNPRHALSKPSSLRSVSYPYCSTLLQALTADTSDLQDMYSALFSCLQQARGGGGGGGGGTPEGASAFVELGASQVSPLG